MATITPNEFLRRIENARAQLIAERPRETLLIATDLSTAVKRRIQSKGENADGKQFAGYTANYAKYGRERRGYQTNYVDLTRTGSLFRSVRPFRVNNTDVLSAYEIRAGAQGEQIKLEGQFKKRGNVLRPNRREIALARAANQDRILKVLAQNGLI